MRRSCEVDRSKHSFVDVVTFTVIATIETGMGAHGLAYDPSSCYVYITNIYENAVSVIDIEQKTVIAIILSGISLSSEVQLEIPESDMMDMPGMAP